MPPPPTILFLCPALLDPALHAPLRQELLALLGQRTDRGKGSVSLMVGGGPPGGSKSEGPAAVVDVREEPAPVILPLFSTERPFSYYLNQCTPKLRSAGLFELFFQKWPEEGVYQEAAARVVAKQAAPATPRPAPHETSHPSKPSPGWNRCLLSTRRPAAAQQVAPRRKVLTCAMARRPRCE